MPDVAESAPEPARSMWADRAYGYPGDGINAFLGAYGKIDAPPFIQARHEEMAALLGACAGRGHRQDRHLMKCGTLFMIGASFLYAERQHRPGGGR